MRNLFDQYDVPENRLTHALASCLAEDSRLLRRFIRWATGRTPPRLGRLRVVQQQIPGEPVLEAEEGERSGLPDAWIHGDGPWSLLIENKVASRVTADQLRRHLRIAERYGYPNAHILVLSPNGCGPLPARCNHHLWSDVYRWAVRERRRSAWAAHV